MSNNEKERVSVVIDNQVYTLSGSNEASMQKIASYVDGKIRQLKAQTGYNKLSPEYRNILLALNIAEEMFKQREEANLYVQVNAEHEQELYQLQQDIVDKDIRIDTANKLVVEYKTKVNELQKRIIELETRDGIHE